VTDPELAVDLSSVGERTIQIEGVLTRSLAAGTGPPLALVHGGGDTAGDWSAVLALLGRSPQVLAPDLPGDSPASTPGSRLLPSANASAEQAAHRAPHGDPDRLGDGRLGHPRHPRPAARRLAAAGLVQLSGCGQVPRSSAPTASPTRSAGSFER
jgi:pimeloyl-ACP methyl ester carboxylesterase